jgi:integrase
MPRKRKPAARRRKGEGTYRYDEKNQRHIWRITKDGKRYEVADRDAARAEARFVALVALLSKDMDIASGKQPLREYAAHYFAAILPNEVGESTQHDYAKRASYYILPTLGDYALIDLKKPVIQAWVNAMGAAGYAHSSMVQALALLCRILDTAIPEILEYNAARLVKAPKAPRKAHDTDEDDAGRALTRDEVAQLRAAVEGTFYEALYALALTLGMRRGELLGLRWRDINFDKQELRVRQQVRQMDAVIEVTSQLKTKNSRRLFPLSDGLVTILLAHIARVEAMRQKAGARWTEHDLVFPSADGDNRRPDNLTNHCARLLKRLGITGHHLHDLRATAITRWRESGADDETTAALAGHDSVSITAKVYSDAEARKRAVIERAT